MNDSPAPPSPTSPTATTPASGRALERSLGPVLLWGLGVGYVISGMYFGWNLGLPEGGPLGLLIATGAATVLYVCFVLGYAELACALPRAGGAFVYASRAFGPKLGFVAGAAQLVEYMFATPAIALAIGDYIHALIPAVPSLAVAAVCYVIFTAVNAYGVKLSASFELVITVLAVAELLLFAGVTLPHFSWTAFSTDPLPKGPTGILAALPFAIWFYLAIEGVANVAEEARDPQKDIPRGFLSAIATLVVLTVLVFFGAVGVDGWRSVVYPPGSTEASNSPLPLAIAHVVSTDSPLYRLLTGVGLLGLVASFHGILVAASRALLEFGRVGYAPAVLGRVHATRHTPIPALVVNAVVGAIALATGKTDQIVTISVFGAVTLYVLSMASLFRLRTQEPTLERPFRTPLYPLVPAVALVLAVVCLAAITWYNLVLAGIYVGIVVVGFVLFTLLARKSSTLSKQALF